MDSTSKLPPELIAYFDGMFDAENAPPEVRAMLMTIVEPFFVEMKDGMQKAYDAGVSDERERCAKLADAEAKRVRHAEEFAPREGAEAFRALAASIRNPDLCNVCGRTDGTHDADAHE
jgi:hypothetical protein